MSFQDVKWIWKNQVVPGRNGSRFRTRLHYGSGVFEGIRYETDLPRSFPSAGTSGALLCVCRSYGLDPDSAEELTAAISDLINLNELRSATSGRFYFGSESRVVPVPG
jgi:branched-subunit amino acid aminotransferase/4-amino-4-deoxychorismate lyase